MHVCVCVCVSVRACMYACACVGVCACARLLGGRGQSSVYKCVLFRDEGEPRSLVEGRRWGQQREDRVAGTVELQFSWSLAWSVHPVYCMVSTASLWMLSTASTLVSTASLCMVSIASTVVSTAWSVQPASAWSVLSQSIA